MKTPEIEVDNIPGPGEPLKPAIHEDNQKLLDAEIAERVARAQARLSKKAVKALSKRRAVLSRQLSRAGWNALMIQRHELEQAMARLQHEIKGRTGREWWAIMDQMTANRVQAKKISLQIQPLQPAADELESIIQRFEMHEDALAFEREDAENRAEFLREAFVWEGQIKAVMKQSARMHHAGTDSKGRYFCDIPKIEQIVFKDDRVLYQIRTTYQGFMDRWLNRWHSALPYDVDINDLTCEETLQNLSAGCNRVVTVERSKRGTNLFYSISRLDAPDGIPKRVLYSKVIDFYPLKDHARTPWAMGVSNDRKVVWATFEEFPHLLLAGSTKGGKSNHLNSMIATMCTMNTPSELGLLLIDLKGGIEFTHWAGLKHQIRPMVKKNTEVMDALQLMRSIMEQRLIIFERVKAKNLESYNSKVKHENKLPRLITIVDEMSTLMSLGTLTTAIHNELLILSSQGRAVGMHLVLCTQHSSVEMVPGWVKTNMSIRASTSMPTDTASLVILGTTSAAKIPKIPGRVVFSMGRDEIVVQSPFISDMEVAQAVTISQAFPDSDRGEFAPDVKAPPKLAKEKFTKEELYTIVLEHLKGKISAKNIFEHLGGTENDVISLHHLRIMVKHILDDGLEKGIDHNGIHYRLKKVQGPGNYAMVPSEEKSEEISEGDTEKFRIFTSSDIEMESTA